MHMLHQALFLPPKSILNLTILKENISVTEGVAKGKGRKNCPLQQLSLKRKSLHLSQWILNNVQPVFGMFQYAQSTVLNTKVLRNKY